MPTSLILLALNQLPAPIAGQNCEENMTRRMTPIQKLSRKMYRRLYHAQFNIHSLKRSRKDPVYVKQLAEARRELNAYYNQAERRPATILRLVNNFDTACENLNLTFNAIERESREEECL
jgi:hypothetical protein